MRGTAMVLLGTLLTAAPAGRAQSEADAPADPVEWSVEGAVRWLGLGDFDVYENSVAVEAQYRNWFWNTQGIAFAAGVERLATDSGSRDWAGRPSGELNLLSIGLSWVGLIFESESDVWTVEAGARFHWAQSDLKLRVGPDDRKVEVGNGVTGLLALGYERRLTRRMSLTAGVSYRPDLLVGDAEFEGGGKLRDNKLEAWGAHLGLRWRL